MSLIIRGSEPNVQIRVKQENGLVTQPSVEGARVSALQMDRSHMPVTLRTAVSYSENCLYAHKMFQNAEI